MEDGHVNVHDYDRMGKTQYWAVELLFGNTDPKRAYDVTGPFRKPMEKGK